MVDEKIKNTKFKVKNRSSSQVIYRIPEDGIRRAFAPGETKEITFGELEKLTYREGGPEILKNFLQILDEKVTSGLNVHTEAEYYMSEQQIVELIKTGSLEAFLDCLDYAPQGVIDLLIQLSTRVPLEDYKKRQALKEKTGYDVDAAIKNMKAEQEDDDSAFKAINTSSTSTAQPTVSGRRTAVSYKTEEATPAETPAEAPVSKYKVVEKAE